MIIIKIVGTKGKKKYNNNKAQLNNNYKKMQKHAHFWKLK